MDKIYAMQIFVCVAEHQSFTRAAESLDLPKATVSRYIQALENRLGTRLLQRTTRYVQLTPDGSLYCERARELLANMHELDGMFQRIPVSISGKLRVDIPGPLAQNLVIPKLREFLQLYPGIELELSSTDRVIDVIREGFDCVVYIGPLKQAGLIERQIGKLTVVNCASADYLARFGHPQIPDDLTTHAVIHYAVNIGDPAQGLQIVTDNQARWIKTGSVLTVNNPETYRAACLTGMGIIQVPYADVKELLQQGSLVEVLPQYRAEKRCVSLLSPHRRELSHRVYLFMTWLTALLKNYVDQPD